MGAGNRSQGKEMWTRGVQYKLEGNVAQEAIEEVSLMRIWRATNVSTTAGL